MTTVNPLVKRCYTMSEPHLSGHRVILGFNTMQEAQDAHDFIASIRPSPADAPCQSAGAVASHECGSVPDERAAFERRWKYLDFARNHDVWGREQYAYAGVQSMWQGWLSRAESGISSPSHRPNEQNAVQTEQPGLSDERERFEAHIRSTAESVPPNNTWFLERSEAVPDMYYNQRYDDMWKGWQAAISAQRQDSDKDAARYRWLRDHHPQSDVCGTDEREEFDAVVDRAIANGAPK